MAPIVHSQVLTLIPYTENVFRNRFVETPAAVLHVKNSRNLRFESLTISIYRG